MAHSVTGGAAVRGEHRRRGPPRSSLISGTRAAFTSGTSLGLRVGVVLLLLTPSFVFHQHPRDRES